ncbi:MAG: protein kinase, partial [Planctomycetes bacterium]|nr:protein kinase [Planctomycetota bacterium]
FEREAKLLASLNHPHIATIHGLEEAEGNQYLILEYIEGETLAERLARGAIPVDEALPIAKQIAEAIEAAHEKGVIHRDLKPANIKFTADGEVKVLDFGLAKAIEEQSSTASEIANSPTMAPHGSPTISGVILGTAGYLSPEQARGRPVDKRADIFAFGCVLFEMLTGEKLFTGETVTDSLASTLKVEPTWAELPADTPPTIHLLLRRCLAKDRKRRLQDIGSARVEIDEAIADPSGSSLSLAAGALEASTTRHAGLGMMLTFAMIFATLAGVGVWLFKPAPVPETLHVAIPVNTIKPQEGPGPQALFDVHPSGTRIAYVGVDPEDESVQPETAIYIRNLEDSTPTKLAGTEHVHRLSFSPNGEQIAYAWHDPDRPEWEMRRVNSDGGPSITLFVDPSRYWLSYPPCWVDDDQLAYVGDDFFSIYLGEATGGQPELFVDFRDLVPDLVIIVELWAPPDGGVLYVSGMATSGERGNYSSIFEVDLNTKEVREIVGAHSFFRLLDSGIAVFTKDDVLGVASWEAASRSITGDFIPFMNLSGTGITLEMTSKGTLVYTPPLGAGKDSRVMSIDREGNIQPVAELRREYAGHVRVSPDGRQLALIISGATSSGAHVLDLESSALRPVANEGVNIAPTWMPDGRYVYNTIKSMADQRYVIVDLDSDDLRTEPLVSGYSSSISFSSDCKLAIVTRADLDTADGDLFVVELETGETHPLVVTSSSEHSGMISPDDRLIAYITNASGEYRVELRTFDAQSFKPGSRPTVVSSRPSQSAFWNPNGSELFWIDYEIEALMAVDVRYEPAGDDDKPVLSVSEPRVVFTAAEVPYHTDFGEWPVHISPDGMRFYYIEGRRSPEPPAYLNVVLNWEEQLKRLVSDGK